MERLRPPERFRSPPFVRHLLLSAAATSSRSPQSWTFQRRDLPGLRASSRVSHQDPKRGTRGGPALPPAVRSSRGLGGGRSPSRCNFLRASFRALLTASALSRAFLSEGFS